MSETLDDAALVERQSAYLDHIRGLGRQERSLGLIACLVGVLVLVLGRFRFGGEPVLVWGGIAVIALGWGLFVWALARRVLWVRAHPFDPNALDSKS